jgi:cyclopropane fatty-acyl-phospholipid synthase-like methyltransferase
MTDPSTHFDAAYFDRFYESRATRVYGAAEIARLARGVTGMIGWLGGDLRSVLDVGAGVGLWRDWFAAHRKDVRYRSTDVSAYACQRYGHEQRDIARWRARERFDLVVCQGVLQYLGDEDAAHAIENIAAMSRGFLFLEVVTARDLREACDMARTDGAVHARAGAWYRARLGEHFTTLGCGLHYRKGGPLVFYELEQA